MIAIFLLMGCSQICRAIHNTLIHHYRSSIFNNDEKFRQIFWNPEISWMKKYIWKDLLVNAGRRKLFWIINYPVQITDGWHLFNTLEIIFHFFIVITALYLKVGVKSIKDIVFFGIYAGIAYNLPFNIFYNWLLIKNKSFKQYLKQSFNIK